HEPREARPPQSTGITATPRGRRAARAGPLVLRGGTVAGLARRWHVRFGVERQGLRRLRQGVVKRRRRRDPRGMTLVYGLGRRPPDQITSHARPWRVSGGSGTKAVPRSGRLVQAPLRRGPDRPSGSGREAPATGKASRTIVTHRATERGGSYLRAARL